MQAFNTFSSATRPGIASAPDQSTNKVSLVPVGPTTTFNHRSVTFKTEIPTTLLRVDYCKGNHLLDDLVQCTGRHGHLLCRHCLHHDQQSLLQPDPRGGESAVRCPVDNAEVKKDKFLTRELQTYPVKCPSNLTYGNDKCTWVGNYKDIGPHIDTGCKNVPLEDRITIMQHDSSENSKTMSEIGKRIEEYINRVDQLETLLLKKSEPSVEKKVESLEKNMEFLIQEMQKLNRELNPNNQVQRQQSRASLPPEFQQRMKDIEELIAADRRSIEDIKNEIASLVLIFGNPAAFPATAGAQQLNNVQAISEHINGTLIWKIDKFASKRRDAISGKTTSIYSPAFLSDEYGYKLCARVYLNGDGMGRGTHISLFLAVMKGEYDALLKWPFRHKVSFKIFDQNDVELVQDYFRPDANSSSFQKPSREMNIASGCPLLMPLSLLDKENGLVKDDTMFIEIKVEDTTQRAQGSN